MGFQGDGEMNLRVHKAANPQFRVTLQAEHVKLNGVDEGMKQRPLRQFLIENNDIEKGQRSQ